MGKFLEATRASQTVEETFLVGSGLTLQVHPTAKSERGLLGTSIITLQVSRQVL